MLAFHGSTSLSAACLLAASSSRSGAPTWGHLSSRTGDQPEPNSGNEQTACVVFDVDRDGRTDIVAKPYTWDTPRLDVWLNQAAGEP